MNALKLHITTTLIVGLCLNVLADSQRRGATEFAVEARGGSTSGWVNLSNLASQDDSYATPGTTLTTDGQFTDYIHATKFNFTIPAGATIDSVRIILEMKDVNDLTLDDGVYIVKAGDVSGSDQSSVSRKGGTDAEDTYGTGSDPLLGLPSLNVSEVNDAEFGIKVAFKRDDGFVVPFFNPDIQVDFVGIIVYYTPITLPIELSVFEAIQNDHKVRINWTTSSEINNSYFVLERSYNTELFKPIFTREGKGNSSTNQYYSFEDENPLSGTNYYRLKQVDYDGQFSYSKIISIDLKNTASENASLNNSFSIYPNPVVVGREFYVKNVKTYNSNQEFLISVIDMNGKELYSKVLITNDEGGFLQAVDPYEKIPAGIYIILGTTYEDYYSQLLVIEK